MWCWEASSRRRDVDASGDDIAAECFDPRTHAVANERAIVRVVDVAHTMLGQPELIDAALEAVLFHELDDVEHRFIYTLHHRRQYMARRFAVLIRVYADRKVAGLTRRLEHAKTCG